MLDAVRSLSDKDVYLRGDTSSEEAVATMGAEFEQRPPVVSLDTARRGKINTDLQRWMGSVFLAVQEFLRLPPDWDSYGGVPLKLDTGMFALQLLYDVMTPRVPVPLVAPTSTGGIQFEWHQDGFELELCVTAPYDCELSFRDRATGDEDSLPLTTDFSALTRAMKRLQSTQRLAG
jgi:hypothetical protein